MINEPYLFQHKMSAVKTGVLCGAARELILLSVFRCLICARNEHPCEELIWRDTCFFKNMDDFLVGVQNFSVLSQMF